MPGSQTKPLQLKSAKHGIKLEARVQILLPRSEVFYPPRLDGTCHLNGTGRLESVMKPDLSRTLREHAIPRVKISLDLR